jgi:hypothetical protein
MPLLVLKVQPIPDALGLYVYPPLDSVGVSNPPLTSDVGGVLELTTCESTPLLDAALFASPP